MKTTLATILAITMIFLWPPQTRSQQSQQPLKHFGYIGVSDDSDLDRLRSHSDFIWADGEHGQSLVNWVTRIKNKGMRAMIDLGRVLWCRDNPNIDVWHLCRNSELSYTQRWAEWTSMNSSVLNSNHVLAFTIITEPTRREIPVADIEAAVALVKQTYPQIPTLVAEGSESINQAYQPPRNADWLASVAYYIHPNLDPAFQESVRLLKLKKQPWQRTAYALDGFYAARHQEIAPTVADMDTIAQEWYTIASRDPDAIALAVFLWVNLENESESALGTISFPQNVFEKQAAIGTAIFAGRFPTYQGNLESIDCQSLAGWAWDSSQPNTPVSVDIYNGGQKIATVRANQFRQDLANAGIGDGRHGFSFIFPSSIRDSQTHSIAVKHSGLDTQLGNSPRSIHCHPLFSYIGFVDVSNCDSIIGWAADFGRPNTPITVSIYDYNGTLVSTVLADKLRGDVGNYLGDNGLHGFEIPTPARFRDGAQHWFSVRFESGFRDLANSPRSINCAPPSYIGFVDVANCDSIIGWAADWTRLNTSIMVSIYDGTTFVSTVLANGLRGDVGNYLGDNGLHGFAIPTPARFKDGKSHLLSVRFDLSGGWLGYGQQMLNCAPGVDTIGLFAPGTSQFFLRNSNSAGPTDLTFGYNPAGPGSVPLKGDWDGNGTDTPGLYNPSTSTFFLRNSNSAGAADLVFTYGPAGSGWVPVTGDWNGDGVDTIGLYNPSTSTFFLRNSNSGGVADLTFAYGSAGAGWKPLAGDWNNDGTDTVALYNPGTSTFFLRNANSPGVADLTVTYGSAGAGWMPLAGDFNNDGTDTVGIYNPSTSTFALQNTNSTGAANVVFSYGSPGAGWIPLIGDWNGL